MLNRSVWSVSLILLALLPGGERVAAQEPESGLRVLADGARRAWEAHDVAGLIGTAGGIQVHLPGAEPSVALGQAQAVATLAAFLRRTVEVEVTVAGAREVGSGRGYVELRRRYRVEGTQETRVQRILLGYRLAGGRWALAEVRIIV